MVRLPVEYQEVEYIESDGGKYLNLPYGFLDTDEVELVCEIHATNNDKYMISPSVWNNNHNRFAMAGNYSSNFRVGFGDKGTSSGYFSPSIPLDDLKHTWRYKNRLFTMLDNNVQIASSDVSSVNFGGETNYLRLFYGYNASTAGRIYSFKQIKQSGESLNLIPCYRKSDSEPGMYDTVTKQFFTNAGTGTFIVGNDVSWDTASLIERRRQILLSTPHLTTESDNPLTFQTDISANLKDCKVYFEPVQEGSGDPSPDNVRPISGWDGVTVYTGGINVLEGLTIEYYNDYHNSVIYPYNYGHVVNYSKKGKACKTFIDCTQYKGHKLTLNHAPEPGGAGWCFYSAQSGAKEDIYIDGYYSRDDKTVVGGGPWTITVPDNDGPMYMRFTAHPDYLDDIKIIFDAEKLTIPFPQTIYGGYVDLVKGEVVEEWVGFTFDGVNNKATIDYTDDGNTNYIKSYRVYWSPRATNTPQKAVSVMCDKLPIRRSHNGTLSAPCLYAAANGFIFGGLVLGTKEDYPDLAEGTKADRISAINAWFADNPTTVVYSKSESDTKNVYSIADGLNHITLGQDISPRPNGRSSTGGYANSSVIGSDGCTFVYFELGWTTEEFLQYSADISRRSEFVSDSRVLTSSTTTNAKLGDMVLSTASTTDYDGDALVYLYVSLPSDCTDLESKRAYLAEHPVKITYPKKTPIPYTVDLTDLKPVKGTNNIWSDANGNIEVKFWKH